jgi:hypothetical protein
MSDPDENVDTNPTHEDNSVQDTCPNCGMSLESVTCAYGDMNSDQPPTMVTRLSHPQREAVCEYAAELREQTDHLYRQVVEQTERVEKAEDKVRILKEKAEQLHAEIERLQNENKNLAWAWDRTRKQRDKARNETTEYKALWKGIRTQ